MPDVGGDYEIVGRNNQIIGWSNWQTAVSPGITITMRWKRSSVIENKEVMGSNILIKAAQTQGEDGESSTEATATVAATATEMPLANANKVAAVISERINGLQNQNSGNTPTVTTEISLQPSANVSSTDDLSKSLTHIQTSPKSIDLEITGVTRLAEEPENTHAEELRKARLQKARSTEPKNYSTSGGGQGDSAEQIPHTASSSRKRAHSSALETDLNHKRMRAVLNASEQNASLDNSVSVNTKAPSVIPAKVPNNVGLLVASTATELFRTESTNPEIIDLISDSDDEDGNSSKTLAQNIHDEKSRKIHQGKDNQHIEIIDLCGESDDGSTDESLGNSSGHGYREPQTGNDDGKAHVQTALGQNAEPGLTTPLPRSTTQATHNDGQVPKEQRQTDKGHDHHSNVDIFTSPHRASKPTVPYVPKVSTASRTTLQTASSVTERVETSLADQASQFQHPVPSGPSSTQALAKSSPQVEAIEEQAHTLVAPQRATYPQKQAILATSNVPKFVASEENQSRPVSAPHLAAPSITQVCPTQRNQAAETLAQAGAIPQQIAPVPIHEHLTAGDQTAQYQSIIPNPPKSMNPAKNQDKPTLSTKKTQIRGQIEPKAQPVKPIPRNATDRPANQATGYFNGQPTHNATRAAGAAPARMNGAGARRTISSQAFQRRTSRFRDSAPRDPLTANNYYHDNIRDQRYFWHSKPTKEQLETAWGHDPKGRSIPNLTISVWC